MVDAGVPVVVGTGAQNPAQAAAHAAHAQNVGAHGLMVIPRVLSRGTSPAAQRAHFGGILSAAPNLPAIIYNSPYYGYETKADLFFDVYRHGMLMNFDLMEPIAGRSLPTVEKLRIMTKQHCLAMIRTQPYQRCVWEGVSLMERGATTPEQRDVLIELQAMRDKYADIFRSVLEQAKAEGSVQFESSSIALQLMFMSLNSPLFWFRRRDGQDDATIDGVASQCTVFALRGLGLKEELIADV